MPDWHRYETDRRSVWWSPSLHVGSAREIVQDSRNGIDHATRDRHRRREQCQPRGTYSCPVDWKSRAERNSGCTREHAPSQTRHHDHIHTRNKPEQFTIRSFTYHFQWPRVTTVLIFILSVSIPIVHVHLSLVIIVPCVVCHSSCCISI